MILRSFIVAGTSIVLAGAALAQTTTPPASTPAPADRPVTAGPASAMKLSDAEAKNWVDKRVYSSDGRNLGEVVAFERDASGTVTGMLADIGGFLGIGETRVKLAPAQFSLSGDRVVLNLTSDQAKALPPVNK